MLTPIFPASAPITLPAVSKTALNNLLEEAVENKDITTVRDLLDRGADPAGRRGRAFYRAAMSGFSEGVKVIFDASREQGKDLSHLLEPCLTQLLWPSNASFTDWRHKHYEGCEVFLMQHTFTAKSFNDEDRKGWRHPEVVDLLFDFGGTVKCFDRHEVFRSNIAALERRTEGNLIKSYATQGPTLKSDQDLEGEVAMLAGRVTWNPETVEQRFACTMGALEIGSYDEKFIQGLRALGPDRRELLQTVTHLCARMAVSWQQGAKADELFSTLLRNELGHLQDKRKQNPQSFSVGEYIKNLTERSEQVDYFPHVVLRIASEIYLTTLLARSRPEAVKNMDETTFKKVLGEAYDWTLSHLTGSRGLSEIFHLCKFMFRPINALSLETRPFLANQSWPPLLREPVELSSSYSLRCLSSAYDLQEEGRAMSHCVGNGTYAFWCSRGSRQVLSLLLDGKPNATILLERVSSNGDFSSGKCESWKVVKIGGEKNQPPSQATQQACRLFIQKCKDGTVPLVDTFDLQELSTEERFNQTITRLELCTGIPFDETELVADVRTQYEQINAGWIRDGQKDKTTATQRPRAPIVDFSQIPDTLPIG